MLTAQATLQSHAVGMGANRLARNPGTLFPCSKRVHIGVRAQWKVLAGAMPIDPQESWGRLITGRDQVASHAVNVVLASHGSRLESPRTGTRKPRLRPGRNGYPTILE